MNTASVKEQVNADLEKTGYYFSLLSDPTRLKILTALCNGERPVNAIVETIETTQANTSRHLNMLYRSKLLARRKEGTQVYYRIKDPRVMDLCRAICRKTAIERSGAATCRLPDDSCRIGGAACRWQANGWKNPPVSS